MSTLLSASTIVTFFIMQPCIVNTFVLFLECEDNPITNQRFLSLDLGLSCF